MKKSPLLIVTFMSIVYAIYTKNSSNPFVFGSFNFYSAFSMEHVLGSLFKFKHIVHYAITYLLAVYAFGFKGNQLKIIGCCFFLGLFIEVLQGFVPSRGASFTDLLPNVLGIVLGALLLQVMRVLKLES